jgi:hypothetical protein
MPFHARVFGTSVALLLLAAGAALAAEPVRVLESDARGVTLRWELREPRLIAEKDGVASLDAGVGGAFKDPGRPLLPYSYATIALPPGARAVARVVDAAEETVRENVRLPINGRRGFAEDREGLGMVPVVEKVDAIRDGAWPASAFELSAPFELRRRTLVTLRVHPFRWDAATARLWGRRTLTVRVDFVGGDPALGTTGTDRHWEPVLRGAVINHEQARSWVGRPAPRLGIEDLLRDERPGQRPAPRAGATGAQAFDESEAEVRLQTDSSGVYAITFAELAAKGFPADLPVAQVSVHRHEHRPGQDPVYETVELPIELDDANGNNRFDAGDTIYCWVLSWGQRTNPPFAQRYWGDGEAIYVTRVTDRLGLRIPSKPGWRNASIEALVSYPFETRFERNLDYWATPPDTNTDPFMWNAPVLSFTRAESLVFETNDLDPTRPGFVTVNWHGRANNSRAVWAHIRNARREITSIVDSVRWFGLPPVTRTTVVPGSAFTNGPSNVFRTWAKNSESQPFAHVSLNWFDVGYWRYFRPIEGRLHANSGDATGVFQIDAIGFESGNIRVYDITDSLAPVRVQIDPSRIVFDGFSEWSVSFQDESLGERRRYAIFDRGRRVPADSIRAVTRRNLADSAPASYLIVTPEEFLDLAQPLADLRAGQGHTVKIAPLESINDEFGGGRKSAHALKRFLRHAYDQWNSEFVVLLGDGSEDPTKKLGREDELFPDGYAGPDWIPVYKVPGPVPSGDARELIPSDNWFVSFGAPQPLALPQMFLGRIPAYDRGQLAAVIQKLVQYESISPDQTWRRDGLLLADDRFSSLTTFGGGSSSVEYCDKDYEEVFRNLSERVREIVVEEAGLKRMNLEIFDLNRWIHPDVLGDLGEYIGTFGDTCRNLPDVARKTHAVITPIYFQRLNRGLLWWNYQGHANAYVLSHEDVYMNGRGSQDEQLFTNVGKPFLFSGFSCHPNAFAHAEERNSRRGTSLGEDMVMLPDRGAIASWGSSGYEILPTPVERDEHLNTHFARALFADPPRDPVLGHGANVVLGEAIVLALVNNFASESGNTLEQQVGISYLLLGDPGTRISIGEPQIMATANGVPVVDDEPVRLFSFGDTLRLEADLVSNVQLTEIVLEYVDAAGTRVIPPSEYTLTPAFPDTGVGSGGGRSYHLSFAGALTAGSYRYVIRTLDRNGVPGRLDVVFQFLTQLRAAGAPIGDGDAVAAAADLSVLILSPTPIDPIAQVELRLNDAPLVFSAQRTERDTSGREWVLSWNHDPYPPGRYEVDVYLDGTAVGTHVFNVESSARLENLIAFPNPFDDELGTRFSFSFTGSEPFDLMIRVFTVTGKLVYERVERGLQPGYQQVAWNGEDAEGQKLANGIYFYKLLARGPSGSVVEQGRLVKLRRPRREAVEEELTGP